MRHWCIRVRQTRVSMPRTWELTIERALDSIDLDEGFSNLNVLISNNFNPECS